MKQSGNALVVVIILIVVLAAGGYFVYNQVIVPKMVAQTVQTSVNVATDQLNNTDFSNAQSLDVNQPVAGSTAELHLNLNQGQVMIDGAGSSGAISGQVKYLGQKPKLTFANDSLSLESSDQMSEQATLHLLPDVATKLFLTTGASSTTLNLKDANTPDVHLTAGLGDVDITFTDQHPTRANITMGGGNIKLHLSPSLEGFKITFGPGQTVPDLGFGPDVVDKLSNGYQTKGFTEGKNNAEVYLIGNFNLHLDQAP